MSKIIISNDRAFIKRHCAAAEKKIRFLVLEESRASFAARDYLATVPNARETTRRDMAETIGANFRNEFSSAMRRLNRDNGSLWWWAMNFTNKLPLMSRLYEDAFHFAAITKTFSSHEDIVLIAVSDNEPLSAQVAIWAKARHIDFISGISARFDIKRFLRRCTPLMVMYMFLKILLRKIIANFLLDRLRADDGEKAVVVTQFESRCIDRSGHYRDIYLGDIKSLLAEFPSMKNLPFITIGFSPYTFFDLIVKLHKRPYNRMVYPDEYFISVKDLARLFLRALSQFLWPPEFKGGFSMLGVDASYLVKNEIGEAVSSGQTLLNLSVHAALSSFSKRYRSRIVYYPFENRSWEKMVLLAFRESSPATKIVGHQHTIITEKHLNFFMEEGEAGEIPMPDKIVTDGEVTNRIMRRWNFPEGILRTGCALRFSRPPEDGRKRERHGIRNILVVLASGIREYVKMMIFLEEAFKGESRYNITLRPHPAIPFSGALKIFHPKCLKYNISHSALKEDLWNCDIVIYASSTVALEAISLGKPVICVELDDFLNSDPMFDTAILKWSCRAPGELIRVVEAVSNADEHDIAKMHKSAREYTGKYFYPISREKLVEFLV
jgi:hypothetical protein